MSRADAAISLWWGTGGGLLRRPGRSFGHTAPGEHRALSHLPAGRGSWYPPSSGALVGRVVGRAIRFTRNPQSGHSLDAGPWQTGPPACQDRAHPPTTLFTETPAHGQSLISPQLAGLESHSQAKPLLQRSLHRPWSPPLPGLAFSLLGSHSSLVVTFLSCSLWLLRRDGG